MGGRWLAVMLLSTAVAANGQEASMPAATAPAKHADQSWIARSNEYANLLVDIEKQHSPEDASGDGFSQYDELISQPTQQDEEAEVAETEAVLAKLKVQLGIEKDKYLKQDLAIIIRSVGWRCAGRSIPKTI